MQLIKTKDYYLPHCWPCEIKPNGKLEYFIMGKGWQKTKSFKIVEGVDLPDNRSELSWLEIAVLFDKYGLEVANVYAERKTAGIVSRQTAIGYGKIYAAIKDIVNVDEVDNNFFECLSFDYMSSCFGLFIFDIVATDKKLASKDKDYDHVNATYKGERISMRDYVRLKYSRKAVELIDKLNEITILNKIDGKNVQLESN